MKPDQVRELIKWGAQKSTHFKLIETSCQRIQDIIEEYAKETLGESEKFLIKKFPKNFIKKQEELDLRNGYRKADIINIEKEVADIPWYYQAEIIIKPKCRFLFDFPGDGQGDTHITSHPELLKRLKPEISNLKKYLREYGEYVTSLSGIITEKASLIFLRKNLPDFYKHLKETENKNGNS